MVQKGGGRDSCFERVMMVQKGGGRDSCFERRRRGEEVILRDQGVLQLWRAPFTSGLMRALPALPSLAHLRPQPALLQLGLELLLLVPVQRRGAEVKAPPSPIHQGWGISSTYPHTYLYFCSFDGMSAMWGSTC